ncbi:MAG: hypothetical protein JNL18_24935 [Planctomycetaceae bacterium]|nr:hypothetical protein [Lacipirellula limnantheis]MBL9165991.1 hypothetical protein [Planctomycetaceae bacterium]
MSIRAAPRVPRPLRCAAAVGWMLDCPRTGDFVEMSRLAIVVVQDEYFDGGRTAVRVVGYRPEVIANGEIQWFSSTNTLFRKDLMLRPQPFARGMRIDLRSAQLLALAMRLDHRIEQAKSHPQRLRQATMKMPAVWAGFHRSVADGVIGCGPEFEALCAKFGMNPQAMLAKFRREHDGLVLFPLRWVNDDLGRATAMFAEVAQFPTRQAVPTQLIANAIRDASGLGSQTRCADEATATVA